MTNGKPEDKRPHWKVVYSRSCHVHLPLVTSLFPEAVCGEITDEKQWKGIECTGNMDQSALRRLYSVTELSLKYVLTHHSLHIVDIDAVMPSTSLMAWFFMLISRMIHENHHATGTKAGYQCRRSSSESGSIVVSGRDKMRNDPGIHKTESLTSGSVLERTCCPLHNNEHLKLLPKPRKPHRPHLYWISLETTTKNAWVEFLLLLIMNTLETGVLPAIT